jgi:ribosome maturation protein Sdo1
MKKSLLFSLFLFLVFGYIPSTAQIIISELNLKGNVKSVKETSFEAISINGKISKGDKKREIEGDFDFHILIQENGLKIREDLFLTKDNESYKRTLNYNEEGFLIQRIWYNLDGSINQNWNYTLNEKGNPISVINKAMKNPFIAKKSYTYNKNGNKTEFKAFEKDGSINIYKEFKYNQKEDLIEEIDYTSEGKIKMKLICNYDDKGNKIKSLRYLTNAGFLFETFNYKYNTKNQKTEELHYNVSKILTFKKVFKYTQKGLIKKIKKYQNINEDSTSELKLIEIKTYKYYFDKQKNWIKKIVLLNKEPIYIFEREIEYF